jgi:hypothetical protein
MNNFNNKLFIYENKDFLDRGLNVSSKLLLPTIKKMAIQLGIKIYKKKKEILKEDINNILFSTFNKCALQVQCCFRGFLVRKWIYLHGESWKDQELVNNTIDFLTMEPIKNINWMYKFNYKDSQGFIYSFDIHSFVRLLNARQHNKKLLNPYNQQPISIRDIDLLKKLLVYSVLIGIPVILESDDVTTTIVNESDKDIAIRRAKDLFYFIDNLGNYSDYQWFINLDKRKIIIFYRELVDIWNYRAGLSRDYKLEICPQGNPFVNMINVSFNNENTLEYYQNIILDCLFKLVTTSRLTSCQNTAALYVLGTLTIVNPIAAEALPWLYESFVVFH